ncbi:DUF397 domain-containing protein [Streptomyces sp. NPDC001604]|uniref:DUF397 domain-containing protein n=1 Tax=Streptomyces sp. NPDC001604 TaxID=3364593 RepID=UPI0036A918D2
MRSFEACRVDLHIAILPTRIAIRDSKVPARATLSFPPAAFTALIDHLKVHPSRDSAPH